MNGPLRLGDTITIAVRPALWRRLLALLGYRSLLNVPPKAYRITATCTGK